MARCVGFKPDNSPCERIVGASRSYCYSHDPDRADERRRNTSRAGKSKPNKELQDIKQRLSDLARTYLINGLRGAFGASPTVISDGFSPFEATSN